LGLVVDNSASMIPKRADVIAAALALAASRNPRDEIFVVHFNERASLALPPEIPFTSDHGQLSAALQARMPEGKTALYDAIALALDHLEKGKTDKRALVVISDGGDNASRQDFNNALRGAQKSNAIIYTIGLFDETDHDRNPAVLRRLANATGGQVFLPRSVQQAAGICRRIAEDIRAQYSLGYVPPPIREGEDFRAIEVRASAPGRDRLQCRTRSGYFVSGPRPEAENRREAIP
jgi:VWFA-related protein